MSVTLEMADPEQPLRTEGSQRQAHSFNFKKVSEQNWNG
jgi:hypothetical protein